MSTVTQDGIDRLGFEDDDDEGQGQKSEFHALFEESIKSTGFKEGEVIEGRIIQILQDSVTIDIGYKSEGSIHIDEFRIGNEIPELKVGDKLSVLLESIENEKGELVLSKSKADMLKAWEAISAATENDDTVEGTIVSKVKGGLAVDIGIKAFLPGSQIDLHPVKNVNKLLGKKYKFKIIKFNKRRGNIVLSRRAILEKEKASLRTETLAKISEGDIVDGIVKNITDYGTFIDLGGIDGLLHITDMSWGRIKHPSEMLEVGDDIKVVVLKFEPDKERVSLGLKQITQDPWESVTQELAIGTKVAGKIVSITDYGAFVEISQGIEGLLHVSEMTWSKRVKHPSKIVSLNQEIETVVLDIDVSNRRVSLGLKQLYPNPWETLTEKHPISSKVKGYIRNITDFGIFVGFENEPDIDGLIHVSDLSWTKKVKHPSEMFKKDQEIEAVVLAIDKETEKFSLGIKQLQPDPWAGVTTKYAPGTAVTSKITKVADFGVFVGLEDNIEGLIHVSELSEDRVEKPSDLFNEGDEITSEVIAIDPAARKISLSIKSYNKNAENAALTQYNDSPSMSGSTLGDVMSKNAEFSASASNKND